jgi:hypothetical protein
MKILVCALTLSCFAVFSATGDESPELHRVRLIVCSQFVIEHPYPAIFPDFWDSAECPRRNNRVHDFYIDDLGERYR